MKAPLNSMLSVIAAGIVLALGAASPAHAGGKPSCGCSTRPSPPRPGHFRPFPHFNIGVNVSASVNVSAVVAAGAQAGGAVVVGGGGGGGGAIINFGSKVGIIPDIGQATYGSNKEAIRGLSRNAAKEWGKYAIRVNVLNPGATSPGAMKWAEEFPELAHAHFSNIPLGYLGDSEKDIGPVALFLASDDGHYVTGQTFNIDGGQVML